MNEERVLKRLKRRCMRHAPSEHMTIFACYYYGQANCNLYKAADLEELIRVQFGDTTIPIPKNYSPVLEVRYGKDYLSYPPREECKPHHQAYYDVEHSYRDYKKAETD